MKKLILIIAIVLGVLNVSAKDRYSHDAGILPESAQAMLEDNFKSKVNHIKVGKQFGYIREYDVVMTDGAEIKFDKHGNWQDIEVNRASTVPVDLVPNPINNFVKKNQGNAKVTGIEKKNFGYEVELSNGVDMLFTEKGKFVRYDD